VDQNTVFWIGGIVAVFVFLDILIVEIRRCVREGRRIARGLAGYAELPIFSLLASTPAELTRLEASLTEIAALLVRARAALAALGIGRART
jgi:hypothetical protein